MYNNCADILSTDTVFGDDDDSFDGDDIHDDFTPYNDGLSDSPVPQTHTDSPVYSARAHATNLYNLSSDTNTFQESLNSVERKSTAEAKPSSLNSNGLGLIIPQPPSEESSNTSIPIANRQFVRIAPNSSTTISSPSPSSPPVFFSLPSPSQFSQVHQPFFNQPHQLHPYSLSHEYSLERDGEVSYAVSHHAQLNNIYSGSPNMMEFSSPLRRTPDDFELISNLRQCSAPQMGDEMYPSQVPQDTHYANGTEPNDLQNSGDPLLNHQNQTHTFFESSYSPQASYTHHPSNFQDFYTQQGHLSMAQSSGSASTQIPLSKKERNRLAAERCRKKKQDLIASLSRENKLLNQGNMELTRANHYLEQKIDYLINVLISIDPTKASLLKEINKKTLSPSDFYSTPSLSPPLYGTGFGNSPSSPYPSSIPYSSKNDFIHSHPRTGYVMPSPALGSRSLSPMYAHVPFDRVSEDVHSIKHSTPSPVGMLAHQK